MKNKTFIATVLIFAALIGGLVYWFVSSGDDVAAETEKAPKSRTSRIADAKAKKAKAKKAKKETKAKATKAKKAKAKGKKAKMRLMRTGKRGPAPDRFAGVPADDRKVGETLQTALDANDRAAVAKVVEAAMASESVAVRELAVEALAWQGKDALPELTGMMADADPGVAEQARDAVENSLTDIDDSASRFQMAAQYMSAFSGNKDALTMFAGVLTGAASEFTDPEDDTEESVAEARANRQTIAETLSDLIAKGGPCAEQAKSVYEDVAGREWTDAASASAWVEDPDAE